MPIFLTNGSSVNLCDEDEETSVLQASRNGNESIVRHLKGKETNINLCNNVGGTLFYKSSV